MNEPLVILVNEQDEATGTMGKMEAHRKGLLHRAFSVFLFDANGRMLLQKRAAEKYHGGGLWSNACCSHPVPGEDVADAAKRRLREELGIDTQPGAVLQFMYRASVENDLIEHEYDHVFAGVYDGPFHPDPAEVSEIRYTDLERLRAELTKHPEQFTQWFRIVFPQIEAWWKNKFFNA